MSRAYILLAEDDPHIREGLVTTLESEGYRVKAVPDGRLALAAAGDTAFDLIILDVMMPAMNGYDVCRALRGRDPHTPIMMVTAKGEEIDKVVGLRLGADDYVTKPFGIHELLARVEALLRRVRLEHSPEPLDQPFVFGHWRVEPRRLHAVHEDQCVALTGRELKLLSMFAKRPGEVLHREDLLQTGWGIQYMGTTRTLDQHIAQLRKKIERDTGHPELIITVHGIGYRYEPK